MTQQTSNPGLALGAAALASLVWTSCQGTGTPQNPVPAAASGWQVEVALQREVGLGGCAVGDLIPDRPGLEIVAVANDGAIHILHRADGRWHDEVIYRSPGQLIQVTCGELDADAPGVEILAVGMQTGPERDEGPGAAVLCSRGAAGWQVQRVMTAPALLHGVAIDAGVGYVTGYDHKIHRLQLRQGKYQVEACGDLPAPGKALVMSEHGLIAACTDGSLVLAAKTGDTLAKDCVPVDQRPAGRARLASDGPRILCADDDGRLCLLTPQPGAGGRRFDRQELHSEASKLRGAVIAELNDTAPGEELVTAGYEARITLLSRSAGTWKPRLLATDTDRIHHLAAGEVDGRPGLEIISTGYSGRVLVLRRER